LVPLHCVSFTAAVNYYKQQGIHPADVMAKVNAGFLQLGEPRLISPNESIELDSDGRYWIVEREGIASLSKGRYAEERKRNLNQPLLINRLTYSCGCEYKTNEESHYYDHMCGKCYAEATKGKRW
jgi:hypothetical protein